MDRGQKEFGLGTTLLAQEPTGLGLTREVFDDSGGGVDEEVIGEGGYFALEGKFLAMVVVFGGR